MPEHLKSGKPQSERSEDDANVRATVEATLADIEARGDAALRDLSAKFDNYAPGSFRLGQAEIDALKSEYESRITELSAGADRQALDRLTDRLLALSGFDAARAPKGDGA